MGHETVRGSNKFDNFVGQQVGFNRRDADAFKVFNFIEGFQQTDKRLPGRASKIANVHARKYDFFNSFFNHFTGFGNRIGNGIVPAFTTSVRDGAIGAKIVAPVLHFQK